MLFMALEPSRKRMCLRTHILLGVHETLLYDDAETSMPKYF